MSRQIKIALLLLISACSTSPDTIDLNKIYRKDMSIEVNGFKNQGTVVVPKANKYKFKVRGIAKLDLFTISTCSREITQEEAGGSGWFTNTKKYEFDFVPLPIEKKPGCPIRLSALTKSTPKHSWGYVDFQDDLHKLPATLQCNGKWVNSSGVSICQSKKGLLQQIDFYQDTRVSKAGSCNFDSEFEISKSFVFTMQQGECVYLFKEVGGQRLHRLTTIGYDQIILKD